MSPDTPSSNPGPGQPASAGAEPVGSDAPPNTTRSLGGDAPASAGVAGTGSPASPIRVPAEGGTEAEPPAPGEAPMSSGAISIPVASMRRARPLDEGSLDDLAGRIAAYPEPIASLTLGVEVDRAEGDATGMRKRLFELAIGVVRYSISVGLAFLAARLGAAAAPRPLADALRRAARLSDGQWCDLARGVAGALKSADPKLAKLLLFTSQKPLADLVTARNDFIHRGGPGNDALECTLAVLDAAEGLLAIPVRVVASLAPASFEARAGTPVRAGVWRKTQGALPDGAEVGVAYLAPPDAPAWVKLSPWLPLVEKKLLVIDPPHAPGKTWRWLDPESGEHREHAPLDQAIKRLAGDDPSAPRELTDRPALVGRAPALKVLTRAAEESREGGIRVVLLTGPFGIGRSRLAHAVAEASAGFGFGRVLDAACSAERRSPLRPLSRAIAGVSGLERVQAAITGALAVDSAAGRAGIDAFIEAIEEALVEASLDQATVLAVDDAQWADEHTLAVLRLLTERATRKASGKLLVVVTARDEPNPSAALRRLVGQIEQDIGSGATRVALTPLSLDDAGKLVQGVAPMDAAIEGALVKGAGGVPFFVVQPLLVWNETGSLEWHEGAWRPTNAAVLQATAPGVRDLLHARLGSYFDPGSDSERAAHHVLACVALYGSGLPIDHLVAATEAAGTPPMAAERALEALVEASLLTVSGERHEHGFAQRIVQQAVLEDMRARPWFRRLHRALLDSLAHDAEAQGVAAFLAGGYEALGARDEAASWLRRAVDAALTGGAFDEAIELGEKLAKTGRTAAERVRAELSVADALLRAGRAVEAGTRLSTVTASSADVRDVEIEARVLALAIAAVLRNLPVDHDPQLVADADAHGDRRLRVEARLVVARLQRGVRGLALADAAVDLAADAVGDLRYRSLAVQGELLVEIPSAEHRDRRRIGLQLQREAARELGSAWAELDAENSMAVLDADVGDHAGAIQTLKSIEARAASLKFGTLQREVLTNIATLHLRAGAPIEAARAAGIVADAARAAGDVRVLGAARSVGANALLLTGDLQGARAACDEAIALTLGGGHDYPAVVSLLRRAEIFTRMGEIPLATADAELAKSRAEAAGDADLSLRASLWLSLRCTRAGEPGAAGRLRELTVSADEMAQKLRPPTRQLLEESKRALSP